MQPSSYSIMILSPSGESFITLPYSFLHFKPVQVCRETGFHAAASPGDSDSLDAFLAILRRNAVAPHPEFSLTRDFSAPSAVWNYGIFLLRCETRVSQTTGLYVG